MSRTRLVALVVVALVVAAACTTADSDPNRETDSGFIYIDSEGSHICGSMLESYPPQCGEPSLKLLDLDPDSVVALMSPTDPALAPVSWTDYTTTVEGHKGTNGLSDVVLADPVHSDQTGGFLLRVADLGITVGDPVTWPFDLTNLTDASTEMTFVNGQRMEVTLSNGSDELYRWSDGMFFTQAIEQVELAAGATLPFVVTTDPIDLPPGEYTAQAWVTATETSDVVVTWNIEITS
ncbi:MAG: hypothetical protein BMS9Abin12_0004 [Acidimicrobiia bacterium]|nr:MAG: hypothetical protein BMS9Abin12_0004 [Acidimicrobiia bacterium]